MTTEEVQIKGQTVTLQSPSSYTLRAEVWMLAAANQLRGLAAAVGMCWRGSGRPHVSYEACRYDAAIYGQRVLDELAERGLTLSEIFAAGGVALRLMTDGLVSEQSVSDAEGNSDAEG